MPILQRRFGVDEELGKRDDDRKPTRPRQPSIQLWLLAPRFRRRRFLSVGALFLLAFVLFTIASRAPKDGQYRVSSRRTSFSFRDMLPVSSGTVSTTPPAHDETDAEEAIHYHNGPITLPRLAMSLARASTWRGYHADNRNVLFASGTLKSMTALVPLACEMARWRRSDVHFAYMGRDDVALHDILTVNGVKGECGVNWHDARPDHSTYSSNARMRGSVHDSLQYLHEFIHPQALLIEQSGREDPNLLDVISWKAKALSVPVISLPDNAVESMMWITRLGSASLNAWNKAEVEILIHVPERSSGGLIRLLKSLASANYISSFAPRITIELPVKIDAPLDGFLKTFKWPPSSAAGHQNANRLSLRHRLHPKKTSIAFIESFYPHNSDTHLLVLSPQAEVSPHFYHYLKYTILEYKYSAYGTGSRHNLLGISLDSPIRYINDTAPFILPSPAEKGPNPSYFLWQAPNPDATLYFGDKWLELHDFVRRRFEAQQFSKKPPIERRLNKRFPKWMEYLLELSRARDYHLLYPHFGPENALVTIHNELYRSPPSTEDKSDAVGSTEKEGRDVDGGTYLSTSHEPRETRVKNHMSLLTMLPSDNYGDLPEMQDLMVLSYNGHLSSRKESVQAASLFAEQFRRDIGGCPEKMLPMKHEKHKSAEAEEVEGSTVDLFCLDDEEPADNPAPTTGPSATIAATTATAPAAEETNPAKEKENQKMEETETKTKTKTD
ncbi:MAG: hypothetical protein M1823_004802 [Watsoniomyces obsoletus]|nr:MAG: hypothetical protein M1823_004802 [Watsoniomyces obsoletus]